MEDQHWESLSAPAVPKQVFDRKRLWKCSCKCGFSCSAFGKSTANAQLMGHVKTMGWLKTKVTEARNESED